MRVTGRAYAKLNLALSVGPPLPASHAKAGMHPIASWMHSIDLWDDVEVETLAAGPSRLEILWAADAPRPSPIDWPPEKDLGARAHRLLEGEAGRELPASIRMTKRVPVGGGLGGGSSDAAAVLLGVNRAFGLGLSLPRLAELSRGLGSDVAYFLDEQSPARPAIVTGLGDRVERTARAAGWAVLVIPAFGCATGAVYRAFDGLGAQRLRDAEVRSLAAGPIDAGRLFNDLTGAAAMVQPGLGPLLERVERASGRPVCISGSGSTLFVTAGDEGSAGVIRAKARGSVPDVTVVGVRLV